MAGVQLGVNVVFEGWLDVGVDQSEGGQNPQVFPALPSGFLGKNDARQPAPVLALHRTARLDLNVPCGQGFANRRLGIRSSDFRGEPEPTAGVERGLYCRAS